MSHRSSNIARLIPIHLLTFHDSTQDAGSRKPHIAYSASSETSSIGVPPT
ncbi:unnamed protein product [Periconia digitata]|uniref:Uncharacterized protein n=1 Tax=Periconia digitata TaxID=1303443 RepID=A0A9W4UTN2_9PLEO|nr:unnamed protein product [Periconia digitata]